MNSLYQKEKYLSTDNICSVANTLKSLYGRESFQLEGKVALLVLDLQGFFISRASHAFVPSAEAIIPNVSMLIDLFDQQNLPVIVTRHINNEENASMMSKWWRDTLTSSNPLSELVPEICRKNMCVVEKSQYDAFYDTELEQKLQGIDNIVITGVMTHLCCETTARSAFVRGFNVFFVCDATATYNRAMNEASLLSLSHGFANIVTAEQIAGKIGAYESF